MIVSVGIDMIEIERITSALENPVTGARFRDRVYTQNEIRYCERKQRRKYESYAARFAAKEAVMKALGRGWGSRVGWRDIEVVNQPSGAPKIHLHDKAADLARERGIGDFSISITHTDNHAMAYVIAQRPGVVE
ncbi:MAG: holo-ACP synthase [Candidatus Binatia bacterium]